MVTTSVKTRAGSDAVVFTEFADNLFGAYEGPDGEWYPVRWNMDGKYHDSKKHITVALDIKWPYAKLPFEV